MSAVGLEYHYTGLESFRSIIGNHQLWAVSPIGMNDREEFRYGFDLLDGLPLASNTRRAVNELRGGKGSDELLEQTFLVCASRDGDVLSQWRSCAQRGGVCLVLDDTKLFSHGVADEHNPLQRFRVDDFVQPGWFPVVHEEGEQQAQLLE